MMNSLLLLAALGLSLMLTSAAEGASWRFRSNKAPTISGSPNTTVVTGSAYSFTPTATDREGDRLRFYIANKPVWAAFDASTGHISGTPNASQTGIYSSISISVSDGKSGTRLPAFTLTVTASGAGSLPNHDPLISGTPTAVIVAGSAYAFHPSASDQDGDLLAFSISGKPAWAAFGVSNGSLSGTPTAIQVGSYRNIVISVNDGKVLKSLSAFAITVSALAASGPRLRATQTDQCFPIWVGIGSTTESQQLN